MFCSKCGTKNEEGAKFCTNCGEPLVLENIKNDISEAKESVKEEVEAIKTDVQNDVKSAATEANSNNGGIRKKMKRDAKGRVTGTLVGATAIYFVACALISAIFSGGAVNANDPNTVNVSLGLSSVSSVLTGLIGLIFTFGLFMAGFKSVKGESFTFTDIFTKPFDKLKYLGYIILLTVIVFAISFVCGLLMLIPILGFLVAIAVVVAAIYVTPAIEAFILLLADPNTKDITFGDAVKKAMDITKGNRVEYYGIVFSFIGWCLLIPITFGLILIWLLPYMEFTMVNMYRRWKKEENFATEETGLSNGAVVGITAGSCGCGCIVVLVFFVGIMAAFIGAVGGSNNPQIQSFINKYVPAEDKVQIENDFKDIMDDYNTEYNG